MYVQWDLSIKDTLVPLVIHVLFTEVTHFRGKSTVHYYSRAQDGVLNIKASRIPRFAIERSHCTT